MRSEHRQYMVDGRNAHHNVQDRQVHAAKYCSKKIDPKAGQREMKPTENYEEQRNNMNHFHNTNLTLSEDYPHLLYSKFRPGNPQKS